MNIGSMSTDKKVYDLLKKGLDTSSLRSKATANNIANINTKGYKRQYVTFEENLKENMSNFPLKTTEDKHIGGSSNDGEAKVETDKSSSMREDGNNVDIDNEIVNQAANTMMYNALISQVNNRMAMERYVINGR
ncbi:flagellar basal body rod protein FlgB [Clostridium sp. A1-XYC3]|uniref:Flagellar basal body rod protein FlgB n=1 Tax=Clostridium tanneri TaxID=3037988 RepID=A0ABU4JNF5_9CLOT|nr:flagellar basal body rod protein FlgB [Clostridium sp. A1-XYC3]MDW8799666.1 flagellar basal body rod protein FlgB [Clostridium sp. A1-XYC3]